MKLRLALPHLTLFYKFEVTNFFFVQEKQEKTQEELEEEATQRYNRAQEMKGRDAPPYVHLSSSEEARSKMGNDIKVDNYTLQVHALTLPLFS